MDDYEFEVLITSEERAAHVKARLGEAAVLRRDAFYADPNSTAGKQHAHMLQTTADWQAKRKRAFEDDPESVLGQAYQAKIQKDSENGAAKQRAERKLAREQPDSDVARYQDLKYRGGEAQKRIKKAKKAQLEPSDEDVVIAKEWETAWKAEKAKRLSKPKGKLEVED